MNNTSLPPARLAWSIWGLGAALFLIGFFHRVAPAVITETLMRDFGLTAAALGNLSAFYFYSYVAMQIPTGILVDRWGARRLLTLGAIVTGLGSLLFALAPTIAWANLGRLLIGGAVAVAYVCMLKLAIHWLPPRRFALSAGLALLVGVIGAVFAGVPLQLLVTTYSWRSVMLVAAVLPFGLSVLIWLVVRDDPLDKGYAPYIPALKPSSSNKTPAKARTGVFAGLVAVLSYRNSWLLTLLPGGVSGAVLTFAGLWGVPFLTTHYGLSTTQAAALTSTLLISWAIGGPLLGTLSDRIGRRKPLYIAGIGGALLGWSLIIFVPGWPIWLLSSLLIVTGFVSGCMIISYAFIKESVPAHLTGTASGFVNMGVLLGPMILQPTIGWLLDKYWHGQMENGVRVYDLAAYQSAFSLMLLWLVLSFGLILLTHETNSRPFTTVDQAPLSERP